MRQCIECRSVKWWFQFYRIDMSLYTAAFDICKACANTMRDRAVRDRWDVHMKERGR